MRILSGMQPSGELHLGNYFGSVKPNVDLLGTAEENFYIIVDLHALTSIGNPEDLRRYRREMVKDLLACGFDPERGVLFFQSDVPAHTELLWILACTTPMGLLERAVSYKDKLAKGLDASVGLFIYPVLQAADILLYDTNIVPVGKDQVQHVEIARDIAQKFNHRYGKDVLTVPEARVREEVAVVPGVDGQKMSKSYGNTIPLFAAETRIKKAIMGIVTDSKDVQEPKDPKTCTVFALHALLLDAKEKEELAERYRAGGLGYGDAKKALFEAFMDFVAPMRERRAHLADAMTEEIMRKGAACAVEAAERTMERVRKAVGLR